MSDATIVADPPAARRRRRPWRDKFRDALRGIKLGIRGHSSFFVHFFVSALVIAAALVLRCDAVEWALLLACIGSVLTAELFNSAVETLVRAAGLSSPRARACLDIAAGAVLTASLFAVLIGAVVFLHRLGLA